MNNFSVVLPLFKLFLVIIIVPVVVGLIYLSERKHVQFQYQLREAKKAFVALEEPRPQDVDEEDGEDEQERQMFRPENNFKLVQGCGMVTAADPLIDDVFDIPFDDALRLHRKVEVLQEFLVEKEEKDKKDGEDSSSSEDEEDSSDPNKPKMVIK